MTWILLDLAIALVALAVLAVLVLGLWRRVRALGRAVTAAGETVGRATDALAQAQAAGPLGAPARDDPRAAYAAATGAGGLAARPGSPPVPAEGGPRAPRGA